MGAYLIPSKTHNQYKKEEETDQGYIYLLPVLGQGNDQDNNYYYYRNYDYRCNNYHNFILIHM